MAAPGLHINQLPDELLLRILVEALREADTAHWVESWPYSAPRRDALLVCRRWADLCNAPPVLASLTMHIGRAANFLPRARSFFGWIPRQGAGNVQQLRLSLGTRLRQPNEVPPPALSSTEVLELGTLLAAALPACAGSLRQLELSIGGLGGQLFPTGLWPAMLGGQLQRLSLDLHRAWLTSSWEALSGLRELELHGYAVLEPACRLPTSLTRLRLVADNEQGALPTQVAALTNLVELECYHHEPYISFDYGALQPLSSSLRRLLLDGAASPPSCLSQLTALESLALLGIYSDMSDEERELFRAALPHLQHLAQLDLYQSSPLPDAADQAAFASCPRLAGFGYNADTEEALPLHGPWLRNLRHLVARLPDVAGSLPALSSTATQLQQLVVCFNCWDDPALSPAVVDWAVHHSSLRKLVLAHQGIEPAVREQLLRAASRRTTLCCQLTG